jgi:hypothetical protein
MDTNTEPTEMATKPIKEHEWLQNLLGEWRIETEMVMEPGEPKVTSSGTSSVKSLGGLWAFSEDHESMPDGEATTSYFSIGYDVTFKEYRACMVMSASSHAWNFTGSLSDDGKIMTLNCEGPSMIDDGTALYRNVIELIDKDHRSLTSYNQDENGAWQEYMKADYYRV